MVVFDNLRLVTWNIVNIVYSLTLYHSDIKIIICNFTIMLCTFPHYNNTLYVEKNARILPCGGKVYAWSVKLEDL